MTTNKGRPKGSPNASTGFARKAIAEFFNGNVTKMEKWLDKVANGIPARVVGTGDLIKDAAGEQVWTQKPDPGQALKILGDVAEYHLPKLSRQDIQVQQQPTLANLSPGALALLELSDDALEAGLRSLGAKVIDAEVVVVDDEPLPDWLKR